MANLEELTAELEALTARVRRLEHRLDVIEPETQPGIGERRPEPEYHGYAEVVSSDSPIIDGVADLLGAFGIMKD